MSKRSVDPLVETRDSPPVSRAGYSDSQSPQAHRGSAQDFERLSKGEVQDGLHLNQRVEPGNEHAWENTSSLHIEDENPKGA
jgi:hypothetical protein